ncbi:hypothetical protein ACHAXR_002750 [Thalassiosira sp. AJA248-18]
MSFQRQLLQNAIVAILFVLATKTYYMNKERSIKGSSLQHIASANYTSTSHNNKGRDEYFYPEKIYGHVHIAKTGGTSLNGIMANKFTRVCGQKGNSYDAYMDNERWKKKKKPATYVPLPYSRSRVYFKIMQEVGYDDCDYVSLEIQSGIWSEIFPNGRLHGIPVELHVPCRDPIDHFMSQARGRFLCNETGKEFYSQINKRLLFVRGSKGRFHTDLLKDFSVKCFDFKSQFSNYTRLMGNYLQERRFQSKPYIQRETNPPRNKSNECIWKDFKAQKKVRDYLLGLDYYKFCNKCIGSANDILVAG